jgi:hypothetical protein
VSAVGLGAFIGFGLAGKSEEHALDECKPCDPTLAAFAARHRYDAIADVSLGVSVVALGLAAYFYFTRPSVPVPTAAALAF